MSSLNAATLLPLLGSQVETEPRFGGPLFSTRRGQVSSVDVRQSSLNYNFVVTGQRRELPQMLLSEYACNAVAKGGFARWLDFGDIAGRLEQALGGARLELHEEVAKSVNPFTTIPPQNGLAAQMPLLKEWLIKLAYPLSSSRDIPAFEYALIEYAIESVYAAEGAAAELKSIYGWLSAYSDDRAKNLAYQLEPYAVGRHAGWFNGPFALDLSGTMTVVGMAGLKADPWLQGGVFGALIAHLSAEQYSSVRHIPKLILLNNAAEFLGSCKYHGRLLECVARRARAYNGMVGAAIVNPEELETSESCRALIDNAAWRFLFGAGRVPQDEAWFSPASLEGLRRTVLKDTELLVTSDMGDSGVLLYEPEPHLRYALTADLAAISRLDELRVDGSGLAVAIVAAVQADRAVPKN